MNSITKLIFLITLNLGFFLFALITFPVKPIFEYFYYLHPDFFRGPNSPEKHKQKVKSIQAQVAQWNKNGRKGFLSTKRSGWKSTTIRDTDKLKSDHNKVEVELGDIVEIDTKNRVVTLEPRIGMGTLTYKLLKQGWTIPVVPELEDLTVGGLICGAGLETSSHKYGLFCNTCIEYEIVLPSGKVVTCSKTENSDLFTAIPMSYGTLGFLTAVKIPIIPAKKYVALKYYSATTIESALKLMSNSTHEFVEGIQYAKDKFVITYGDFTDSAPPNKIRTFLGWRDPFFYLDTERFFHSRAGSVPCQFIPLRDYYHRHTKGWFWTITIFSPIFIYTRYLFGWLLPLRLPLMKFIMDNLLPYKWTTMFNNIQHASFFGQDYVLPAEGVPTIVKTLDEEVGTYPIWFCPAKGIPTEGMIKVPDNKECLFVDIGVYGISPKELSSEKVISLWKRFEKMTLEAGGAIGFYTDNMVTREEFHEMFNHKLYLEVRKKYGCDDAYPMPYDKVQSTRALLLNNSSSNNTIKTKRG